MKALLICPSKTGAVACLSETTPLAAAPLLGESLIEYWLSYLAALKFKEALVLADDRPEQVRALVGSGDRWGLKVTITEDMREMASAHARNGATSERDPKRKCREPLEDGMITLDHLPGFSAKPLFASYADWFAALQAWMPRAITPDRVGMHQVRPGLWLGLHSRVSRTAQLHPPCWIGDHVYVGDNAVVGPHAVIENGSFLEAGAELVKSWVARDTFVGALARLTNSLACGNTLVNWQTGSSICVPDAFLLSWLRSPRKEHSAGTLVRWSDFFSRNKEEIGLLWNLLMHKEG